MSVTDKKPWEKYSPEIAESDDLKPWEKYVPSEEKKNPIQNDLTSGTQTSKRGFEPFQTPVDTKTPSVLTPKGKTEYQEQVKAFKPLPIPKEGEPKPKKADGGGATSFMKGLNDFNSNVFKTPRLLYDAASSITDTALQALNLQQDETNYDDIVAASGYTSPLSVLDRLGDYYAGKSNQYAKRQEKFDKGIIDSFTSGDIKGGGKQLWNNIAESIPSMVGMAVTGGAGNIAKLKYAQKTLASSLPFISGRNAELSEDESIPKPVRVANSVLSGLSEVVFDQSFGTTAMVNKVVGEVFKNEGRDAAIEVGKDFIVGYANNAIKKIQPLTGLAKGAVEEMATTMSTNIVDKYTIDPERDLMEGVLDAGLVGGVMTGGVGAIGTVAYSSSQKKKVADLMKQREELVNDLDNDNLPDEVKSDLSDNLSKIDNQISKIDDDNEVVVSRLSDEDKAIVQEKEVTINAIEKALQDETISETTKNTLADKLLKEQDAVDEILTKPLPSLEKPTIDTEEQIIAEGQQAEADFQATDDLVTYEQKMKELDDRANQLIPEPTQEAPKAEGSGVDGDKIFYHGTPNKEFNGDFDERRIGERDSGFIGRGFYFTEDKSIADQYQYKGGKKGKILERKLDIKNPLLLDKEHINPQELSEDVFKYIDEERQKKGKEPYRQEKREDDIAELTKKLTEAKHGTIVGRDLKEWIDVSDYAKSRGYDAIIGSKEVVVFDKSQIKQSTTQEAEVTQNKQSKPQEDAVNQGNIEQSNITEREGVTEQQQGQQEDRKDQEESVTESQTKTSDSGGVVESREVEEVNFAKSEIEKGAITWDGDRFSPRPDLGIEWTDIRKGQKDILAGKDTVPARRLIKAINKAKEEGGYTFIQGSGGIVNKMFVPISEAYETALTSNDIAEITANEAQLAKEYDDWFNNLSEEEKNQELNFNEDENIITSGESKENVSNQKDAKVAEGTKAEAKKPTRTLAEIEKDQRKVMAKFHDALKEAGIYEQAKNEKANPNVVEKIRERFSAEADALKAEKDALPKTPSIKSSFDSNIEALINPETGMSAVIKRLGEQIKPYQDAFMKRTGITLEGYRKLSDESKRKIDQQWRDSKEYADSEKSDTKSEPNESKGVQKEEVNEKVKTEEVKRPIETPRVAEPKGESAKLQTAKEKLAEAKAKLDALNKNLGIASDPEQKAKALFEYHKALVNYAIEYIKDVANDIAKFAKEVGLDVSEVKDAWIEASGGEKKTVKDFIPTTTLRNADVEQKRADYGFDEPTVRPKVSNPETLAKAIKAIQDNPNVPYDVIDKALNGESLDAVEMAILAQFQGIKEAELIDSNNKIEEAKDTSVLAFDNAVDKRNKIIDDLVMAYDASEISGTVAGRALQARKIKVLQDYSIANMLIRVRKANNNRPLTNEQVKEVTDKYNKLVEAETKYQERIAKLEEENAKLKSQQSFNRIRTESAREAREAKRTRTKETLAKERESIFEQMRKLAKKGRGELSANPIPAEMIPLIGKLAKNYFIDGITSIEAIVDKIYGDVKDIVEGLEKRDVRDAISGYSRDTRPTKDDLQADIRDLKQQAELISRIEDAEKGMLSKNERVKTEASEEVKKLRARLKDLTKEEVALEQLKTRIKRQISETTKKINNKDYSKKEPNVVELDEEAKKLRDAYRKIKFEFDVAVAKDQLESRTKGEKLKDLFIEIANIPRALMATADLSAPLRQGILPTISNPIMASRAFSEMLKQWSSQERADTWLADLKDSPAYQLMQDSDLYIADRNNPQLAAKEEDFQTNLAEKIPMAGILIKKSERAYVSYLNKMRVDLFTKGVDVLQNQGITFAQKPQAYKALASYINASTGRGGMGALERAAPVFNTVFFSPRLIASRLQLLTNWANPVFYKNTPKAVRNMYFKDMAQFISFGLGILVLASLAGGDVEDDPRSPDFAKIRHGNTRWDIWGGMQQVVRYMAQFATGQKKSSASGRIVELDGTNYNKETRLSVIGNFVRSKLAPIPAFLYNALAGENMVGERFKLEKDVPQMLLPLVGQGIYDSYKQDGLVFAIGATAIPSILGVGVQTYGVNDFLQQGVDNKAINLLLSKKAVAIEPKEVDKTIYDINTGEERQMTSSEFKKYYSKWTEYIKDNLNSNYDVFSKMTNEQFEKEFRSMKTRASKLAKEEVSGVSSEVIRIEENDVTYQLTPKQVKERLQLNKEYEAEFGSDIVEAQIEVAKENGKSLSEAQIIADKKLKSSANRYSKYQMLEKYTDANGNIKLNIK